MKKIEWMSIKYLVAYGFIATAAGFGVLVWQSQQQVKMLREEIAQVNSHIAILETSVASTTGLLAQNLTDTRTSLSGALDQAKTKCKRSRGTARNFQKRSGEYLGLPRHLKSSLKLLLNFCKNIQKYFS